MEPCGHMAEYIKIKDNSTDHIVDEELLADAIEWYLEKFWESKYKMPNRLKRINNCGRYVQTTINYRPMMIHRLLMMYKIKGLIPEKHAVHHINGNPRDNRIENLQIIHKAEHASFHTKGRKLSEAHKKAIGDASRGKPRSDEVKAKISAGHKGKVHSEETRKKLSQINLGKKTGPRTEEQKARIAEGTRKAWIKRKQEMNN